MTRYMVTTDAGTLELSAHHPLDAIVRAMRPFPRWGYRPIYARRVETVDAYHARKWGELRRDGLDIRDGWTLGRPL